MSTLTRRAVLTLVIAVAATGISGKAFAQDPLWTNIERAHAQAAAATAPATALVLEWPTMKAKYANFQGKAVYYQFLNNMSNKLAGAELAHANAIRACEVYLKTRGYNANVASLSANLAAAKKTIADTRAAVAAEYKAMLATFGR
jgi:hypothetical protein